MRTFIIHMQLMTAFALLLSAGTADAQNITGYRYWFNDNIADATVVNTAPAPAVDAEIILNSASLAPGHHLATIQFRDADGLWSAPWSSLFVQRSGTVSAIEYWFDDEIGDATTASVTPGPAPLITAPLDATALPVGFHTVTVRTIDAQGERSVPFTENFTRNGGLITGYEYWIDDAIADRTIADIGPAGVVDLIEALPVPTTDGAHTFTIHFRDADGGWSVPLSSSFNFIIGVDEIPGVSNYLLFPNPVNDQLSLRVDAAMAKDLSIEVLDASGRTVQALGAWNVQGTAHRSWDASFLAPGGYLLRISSEDRTMQMPFVKQ
ncbi:MAG: T9SS type A sorting domain-containing protein [Flavobacteriales bacterium]|nr:T9SS type A sorting domain-containing protein [Flavobacteriales bacterium]